MASYDQIVRVKASHSAAAKAFLAFLRAVGRKYVRPTRINYRYLGRGRFYVVVDGSSGGIDALFQELILNKGLYYYVCSIRGDRRKTVSQAIVPLFQDLLEERFPNPYSRFLRRHLTGKPIEERYVPGECRNPFSHQYEVLFRRWDIGSLDDWNFIKDLDAFLTRFMLTHINHRPEARSPKFANLVDVSYRRGLGMVREIKSLFNEVHKARTDGLHRLKISLGAESLSQLAFRLHTYFVYFDEFQESQSLVTEVLHGRRYRRIRYGSEVWLNADNEPHVDADGQEIDAESIGRQPCHDCGAIAGQYHCFGCDVEQCPRCRGQRLGCPCKLKKDC